MVGKCLRKAFPVFDAALEFLEVGLVGGGAFSLHQGCEHFDERKPRFQQCFHFVAEQCERKPAARGRKP
ncbi:hypothetical protein D3C76_1550530 [compost metagenome]